MRLIPHEHAFEPKSNILEQRSRATGHVVKRIMRRQFTCRCCGMTVRTENEVRLAEQDAIVLRATALTAWAMALGMFVIGVVLMYRWSFVP